MTPPTDITLTQRLHERADRKLDLELGRLFCAIDKYGEGLGSHYIDNHGSFGQILFPAKKLILEHLTPYARRKEISDFLQQFQTIRTEMEALGHNFENQE